MQKAAKRTRRSRFPIGKPRHPAVPAIIPTFAEAADNHIQQPPQAIAKEQRSCQPEGQVELLHQGHQQGIHIIVAGIKQKLMKPAVKLPVVRKACHKENRGNRQHQPAKKPFRALPQPPGKCRHHTGRHHGQKCQHSGSLNAEPGAQPQGCDQLPGSRISPPVLLQPQAKHQPAQGKD